MSESDIYVQFRQSIDATIEGRMARDAAQMGSAGLHILAEGDSWFDYPIGTGSDTRTDLLQYLPGLFPQKPRLLSLAHYGDATTQMLGVAQRLKLQRALARHAQDPYDVILFSGGGNDIVGETLSLFLNDASKVGNNVAMAVNQSAIDAVLGVIEAAYLDLMALRNDLAPGVPIVANPYDFALPTNKGVCGIGPWIYPSLHARGWMSDTSPDQVQRGAVIVRAILDRFLDLLTDLSLRPDARLFIAGTRGTLSAGEWANELHPTPGGARKLAARFKDAIETAIAPA